MLIKDKEKKEKKIKIKFYKTKVFIDTSLLTIIEVLTLLEKIIKNIIYFEKTKLKIKYISFVYLKNFSIYKYQDRFLIEKINEEIVKNKIWNILIKFENEEFKSEDLIILYGVYLHFKENLTFENFSYYLNILTEKEGYLIKLINNEF